MNIQKWIFPGEGNRASPPLSRAGNDHNSEKNGIFTLIPLTPGSPGTPASP